MPGGGKVMRSLWLTALAGAMVLCLLDFGTVMTAPVSAADNAGADIMPICTLPKCLNPRVTTKSGIGTANATAEAKIHPDDAAKWCATYKPKDKLCVQEQVRSGWVGFKGLYRANADCITGRMTAIDGNTYTYIGVWEDGPGKGRPKFTTTNRQFPHTKWDETGVTLHPSGSITGWGGGSPNLATQWEVLCAGAPAPAVKVSQPPAQAPPSAPSVPHAVQIRQSELQQFAAETQLQSADFGTPEATAKIAAKAGFIDVVGVKLGTPLKSAIATLKAHNSNLTMEPQTMAPFEALPGVIMTPLLMSKKYTSTASNQEKETVGLLVTFAPNEPFVWGMWREIWYEKEENRPTIETILGGLRSKYGQESLKDVGTRLIWMYDAQGQQMKEAQTRDLLPKCRWNIEGNNMLVTYYPREVVGGYYHSSYGQDSFNGLCHSYAVVVAEYMAQTPIGKTSPPLVSNVKVYASNHQLEVSGVTAAHRLLIQEATKLAESRKGEAAKREIPKF
jgi:hypothetical protein